MDYWKGVFLFVFNVKLCFVIKWWSCKNFYLWWYGFFYKLKVFCMVGVIFLGVGKYIIRMLSFLSMCVVIEIFGSIVL